jgi:hypothetical protein
VDVFTPASRNKKKQEIPGDVFSPAPRNTRELVSQKGLMEIGM